MLRRELRDAGYKEPCSASLFFIFINSMKAESISILEKHRAHWLTLRDAGYIKQIEYKDKKELQDLYLIEIGKEHFNLWCGECVAIMIRRLYTTYENQRVQVTTPPPELEQPKKRTRNNAAK